MTTIEEATASTGLSVKTPLVLDGNIHRFHVNGDKNGKKNGWYIGFEGNHKIVIFGSWKTGQRETWSENGRRLSEIERQSLNEQIQQARKKVAAEKRKADELAALTAKQIWSKASAITCSHPYLLKKNVRPHNLRLLGEKLLVPLHDIHGMLWNMQRIFPDGKKLFYSGRAKGLFSPLGDISNPDHVIICEGWATGATLHEDRSVSVLCAMNAGNLLPVAKSARAQWPHAHFTIAADNDRHNEVNTGLIKAREAALAIDAKLEVPEFPEGCEGTDFNDLANLSNGRVL